MFNKAFFKNVIIFSVIIAGALLALYVFDIFQTEQNPDTGTNLESFVEGDRDN